MKTRNITTATTEFFFSTSKAFATLLIGVATIGGVSAQTHNRVSAVDMMTGRYAEVKQTAETTTKTNTNTKGATTATKTTQYATVNTPTAYIHGEDKYLKAKEDGKRYGEFEVYDINGKDKDAVMLGLLTNTLDRAKRFDDKGAIDKKIILASTMIDKIDASGKVFKGEKVRMSAIRFNDKIFVIIGENDYRYLDGKKIVGDTKLTEALTKGKPITEMTFFYELQHAGYVKNMTAKQFRELTLAQKERLLNNSNVAVL